MKKIKDVYGKIALLLALGKQQAVVDMINTLPTDPQRVKREDKGSPAKNCRYIYPLHKLVSSKGQSIEEACQDARIGCTDCKAILLRRLLRE